MQMQVQKLNMHGDWQFNHDEIIKANNQNQNASKLRGY